MTKDQKGSSERKVEHGRGQEQGDASLDKAPDRHVVRNASGRDMENCEEKRSNKWEGSFTGSGQKAPALKPGMTLKEAQQAHDALNANRFAIDFGDGAFETSDSRTNRKQHLAHDDRKDKFLPFGTDKQFEMTEKEAELIDEAIARLKDERDYDHRTVKPGDNLWDLARDYYGDATKWGIIFRANQTLIAEDQGVDREHADPRKIFPGQDLRFPKKEFIVPNHDTNKK